MSYFVLPAMPSKSPENEFWLNKQRSWGVNDTDLTQRVENRLIEVYTRESYGYERYVTDMSIGSAVITVLGHTVTTDESSSSPGARLLLRRVAQEFEDSDVHSTPRPSPSPLRHRRN